ncbi:MAG: AGE family epimerase/isomerase [Gammaproteobacteria bacterium]|nr:AGE family epimerase/isomerase [Gammaproteobacteria bacterium]
MLSLPVQSQRFTAWLQNSALPFWSQQGINPQTGAVYEKFNADHQPDLGAVFRSRVQARQIFVFAAAYQQGWLPDALPVVAGIQHFLNRHAKKDSSDAGYVHSLTAAGEQLDQKLDAYDFAFFLLSCAYRYQSFSDLQALDQANKLLQQIEHQFRSVPGGWMEGDYSSPYRRQNPHMHLFEAFLALYQVTKDGKWLAKAGQIYTLFETVFFRADQGVLLEYFTDQWLPLPGPQGQIVEPGHMFEWVWLLRWYQQLTGTPVDYYCETLYQNGLKLGLEASTGLIYDEVVPGQEPLKKTKRLWPLTELIKASLAQAKASSEPEYQLKAEQQAAFTIDLLFRFYLPANVTGLYVDQLDANNQVCVADAPASTLYHLMVAGLEARAYCQTQQNGKL